MLFRSVCNLFTMVTAYFVIPSRELTGCCSRQGLRNAATLAMLTVIVILYSSTLAYWITFVCNSFRQVYVIIGYSSWATQRCNDVNKILYEAFPQVAQELYSSSIYTPYDIWGTGHQAFQQIDTPPPRISAQSVGTITLTINVSSVQVADSSCCMLIRLRGS